MATAFETLVNTELPLRPDGPAGTAGNFLRIKTTGLRSMEERTPTQVLSDIAAAAASHGHVAAAITDFATAVIALLVDANLPDTLTLTSLTQIGDLVAALAAKQAASANLDEYAAVNPTAAGLALLDDATAADQRTTLGLGTLATQSGTFSGTSSGTNTGDQTNISGSSGSCTGNAATVTTNANLTGPVTSVGNATKLIRYFLVRIVEAKTNTAVANVVGGDVESPIAGTVVEVGAYVDTAGTTGSTTVDINKNSTTILSTKITIETGEKSSRTALTAPVISVSDLAVGDVLTFDIDGISTTAAKGLTVRIGVQQS